MSNICGMSLCPTLSITWSPIRLIADPIAAAICGFLGVRPTCCSRCKSPPRPIPFGHPHRKVDLIYTARALMAENTIPAVVLPVVLLGPLWCLTWRYQLVEKAFASATVALQSTFAHHGLRKHSCFSTGGYTLRRDLHGSAPFCTGRAGKGSAYVAEVVAASGDGGGRYGANLHRFVRVSIGLHRRRPPR